jgi:hypothetical protein
VRAKSSAFCGRGRQSGQHAQRGPTGGAHDLVASLKELFALSCALCGHDEAMAHRYETVRRRCAGTTPAADAVQ